MSSLYLTDTDVLENSVFRKIRAVKKENKSTLKI